VLVTRTGFRYLHIFVVSQGDTTLVVRGQNGAVYCNDDGGGGYGLNPSLDMNGLPPGRYDIFVGSYSNGSVSPYTLFATENAGMNPNTVNAMGTATPMGNPQNTGNGSGWGQGTTQQQQTGTQQTGTQQMGTPQGATGLRTDLPPTSGRIAIHGSLRRAEARTARIANATQNASSVRGNGTCRGWIAEAPSFVVTIDQPQPFLRLFLNSAADTTLVVQYPDGHAECSDDSYGTLQPSVEGQFPAGTYYVWAGIYRSGMERPYRLSITANGGEHP
jgi:hypothetical protein